MGGSAGLNLHAAVELSKTAKPGSVIVAILADNGVKYLTKIYNEDWIKAKVLPLCNLCLDCVFWLVSHLSHLATFLPADTKCIFHTESGLLRMKPTSGL